MKKINEDKIRKDQGQSTIEFVLVILFIMSYFCFFFQLSMVFAFGNYVHYATFMAARAFLSAGASLEDQESRAQDVIVQMLKKSQGQIGVDKFPSIAVGASSGTIPGYTTLVNQTNNLKWMTGVRYVFRGKIFVPFGAIGSKNDNNQVEFTSESFLGKEPSYSDCLSALGAVHGIFDNGC